MPSPPPPKGTSGEERAEEEGTQEVIRHTKFRPYIRRANGRERAEGLRMALRLEFYRLRGEAFYVLVQRGFPRDVMAVGRSRDDIAQDLVGAFGAFVRKTKRNGRNGRRWSGKSFRAWAKRTQRYATAGSRRVE